MDIGDLLDLSIKLYRENFVTFLGIYAVVYLPFWLLVGVLLQILLSSSGGISSASNPLESPEQLIGMVGSIAGLVILSATLSLIVQPIATGALARAVSERFLGREITIREAYRFVLQRFWPLVIAMLLQALLVLAGASFLIVPGLIIAVFLAFIAQVVVLEGVGYSDALTRSWRLVSRDFWKVAIVMALLSLLVFMVGYGSKFAVAQLSEFISKSPGGGPEPVMPPALIISTVASGLISVILDPIKIVGRTLLYYDLRIRREGYDLQVMAGELGYQDWGVVCPRCQYRNPPGSQFCGKCRNQLSPQPPPNLNRE